jgi:hypothetical protein
MPACRHSFSESLPLSLRSAAAVDQSPRCSIYLMAHECVQYREQLQHATTLKERSSIESKYRQIVQERRQACRCVERNVSIKSQRVAVK